MASGRDLIPPATAAQLIAAGFLARSIDAAITKIARNGHGRMNAGALRALMADYPGRPAPGTSIEKGLGRWRLTTHLPGSRSVDDG